MKASKPKLMVTKGKIASPVTSASASKSTSPLAQLAGKKNYKKQEAQAVDFGTPSFGQTGMTGES